MFRWKGNNIEVVIDGTSHAAEMSVEFCGFPKESFEMSQLLAFLDRRRATNSVYSTSRTETDEPVFLQGVSNGAITGDVRAVVYNKNVRSGDYNPLFGKPRPSHADYAAFCKDGRLDFSGGGEFSGRMTAPLCVAGGIAKQFLQRRGISVEAYVSRVGGVCGMSYKTSDIVSVQRQSVFPSLSNGEEMLKEIANAKQGGDSVGGVVECVVLELPAGLGGALFDGLESKLAYLLYAIPAVKGVEFGSGFCLAEMRGSVANDALQAKNGNICAITNNAGGINGGVSNGMPITMSVAFRPTPSIALPQQTVDLVTGENVTISVQGRHDACIVPRAVPVVEAAVSLAILDIILGE